MGSSLIIADAATQPSDIVSRHAAASENGERLDRSEAADFASSTGKASQQAVETLVAKLQVLSPSVPLAVLHATSRMLHSTPS